MQKEESPTRQFLSALWFQDIVLMDKTLAEDVEFVVHDCV